MKIDLGSTVKDTITGFVGIVTGRCEYLYGCVQCSVKPTELKDGAPQKAVWIDEPQLEVVKPDPERKTTTAAKHGPRDTSGMGRSHPEDQETSADG